MKHTKWIAYFLVALLLLSMVACGEENPPAGSSDVVPFSLTYQGVTVIPHEKAAPIIAALGEGYEYHESTSCAFVGLDKVYTYADIEIYTYPKGDEDFVLSVALRSDAVATDKGITIGSSGDEVIDAYGEGELHGSVSDGEIGYTAGNTYLKFLTRAGNVYYVEYGAITE